METEQTDALRFPIGRWKAPEVSQPVLAGALVLLASLLATDAMAQDKSGGFFWGGQPQKRTGPDSSGPATMSEWMKQTVEVISRNKRYPKDAVTHRVEGQVLIEFTLARDGHLVASKILESSGSSSLDGEALDLLKRTEPFAPIPSSVRQPQITLKLPLRFSLGDQTPSSAHQNPRPSDRESSGTAVTAVETKDREPEQTPARKDAETTDRESEKTMAKVEAERKGRDYAHASGTSWSVHHRTDPMTDKEETTVKSVQKNDRGAVTTVEGKCLEPGLVEFSALVVDSAGNPTLPFPLMMQRKTSFMAVQESIPIHQAEECL